MIQAKFFESKGKLKGFCIEGHSGYGEQGTDIVCASVSSAVQLTSNAITEGYKIKAKVSVINDTIELKLIESRREAEILLDALRFHLQLISEDFPKTIKITTTEV